MANSLPKHHRDSIRRMAGADPIDVVNEGVTWDIDEAQGRPVPILVVNASNRPDIKNLFVLHQSLGRLGNTTNEWIIGDAGKETYVFLLITVNDPTRCTVLLHFDLPMQAYLVDLILESECFKLQIAFEGDIADEESGWIFIEVFRDEEIFGPKWPDIKLATFVRMFRSKGLTSRESKRKAHQMVDNVDSLVGDFKLRNRDLKLPGER